MHCATLLILIFTGFLVTFATPVNTSVLQLASDANTTSYSLDNNSTELLQQWPPENSRFHVEGDLYVRIWQYGKVPDSYTTQQMTRDLAHIDVDIKAQGDPSDKLVRRSMEVIVQGRTSIWIKEANARSTVPCWTRERFSTVISYLALLIYTYGPRSLTKIEVKDEGKGINGYVSLQILPERERPGQLRVLES